MMGEGSVRQLTIQTGVVKRTTSELLSYIKELSDNTNTLNTLKSDPTKDPADIRQAENVAAETQAMIPDTRARLLSAVDKLEQLLASVDCSLSNDLVAAQQHASLCLKEAHDAVDQLS
mmetsp:Transcript_2307/g.4048  ORF Transcript_2307/g.4048 Transcript_2307/m.4048 type:complete len:118 (-) Transcript_2307:175-528(-)